MPNILRDTLPYRIMQFIQSDEFRAHGPNRIHNFGPHQRGGRECVHARSVDNRADTEFFQEIAWQS